MSTLIVSALSFAVGAVVCYLFMRNNPKWKDEADKAADDIEQKIK